MFDVGFWELVLIFGLGLIILGPERLPRVANRVGRWVGKARRTAGELRRQLERELDFDDLAGKPNYHRPKPPPPPSSAASDTSITDHAPANHTDLDPDLDPEIDGDEDGQEPSGNPEDSTASTDVPQSEEEPDPEPVASSAAK